MWTELLKRRNSLSTGDRNKFQPSDYDMAISNVTTKVRYRIAIDPKSLRLADSVAAWCTREEARKEIGELADKLDHFEYRLLSAKNKTTKRLRALTCFSDPQATAASLWSRLWMHSSEGSSSSDSPKTVYSHICNRSAPSMSVKVGVTLALYHGRSLTTCEPS